MAGDNGVLGIRSRVLHARAQRAAARATPLRAAADSSSTLRIGRSGIPRCTASGLARGRAPADHAIAAPAVSRRGRSAGHLVACYGTCSKPAALGSLRAGAPESSCTPCVPLRLLHPAATQSAARNGLNRFTTNNEPMAPATRTLHLVIRRAWMSTVFYRALWVTSPGSDTADVAPAGADGDGSGGAAAAAALSATWCSASPVWRVALAAFRIAGNWLPHARSCC